MYFKLTAFPIQTLVPKDDDIMSCCWLQSRTICSTQIRDKNLHLWRNYFPAKFISFQKRCVHVITLIICIDRKELQDSLSFATQSKTTLGPLWSVRSRLFCACVHSSVDLQWSRNQSQKPSKKFWIKAQESNSMYMYV